MPGLRGFSMFRPFDRLALGSRRPPVIIARHRRPWRAIKKGAVGSRAFLEFYPVGSASCREDRRSLGTTTNQPYEKYDAGKSDHCLGGNAPAGFLNAVFHDFLCAAVGSSFRRTHGLVRPLLRSAGYAFRASFATAKTAESWRIFRPNDCQILTILRKSVTCHKRRGNTFSTVGAGMWFVGSRSGVQHRLKGGSA